MTPTLARRYDPMMGRFLQTDPTSYGGGANLYRYANADPVNGTDPSGLAPYMFADFDKFDRADGSGSIFDDAGLCSGAHCVGDMTQGAFANAMNAQGVSNAVASAVNGVAINSTIGITPFQADNSSDEPETTPDATTNVCQEYCGGANLMDVGTLQLLGPGGQPYVPLSQIPRPSQYILQGRFFDPESGQLNLTSPPGYQLVHAPQGGGYLLVPPNWSSPDNRNVIRIQPSGTGSSLEFGYTNGYYVVTNQAGATISIFSGLQFPVTSPAVHNPYGTYSPF